MSRKNKLANQKKLHFKNNVKNNEGEIPTIQVVSPIGALPSVSDRTPIGRMNVTQDEKDRCKEIASEAEANKKYYITKDPNKSWFKNLKKTTQYSEYVMINGAMAADLLNSMWQEIDGNRPVDDVRVSRYKRDMEEGRWTPTTESICIDYDGQGYDGRHRLTAIFELSLKNPEFEIPLYVTFNGLTTARFVIDSGKSRSLGHKLKLVIDSKIPHQKLVAVGRSMMIGMNPNKSSTFTDSEIALFVNKHLKIIEWVGENSSGVRSEVQAAFAKAYMYYGEEKISAFVSRYKKLNFTGDSDPAKTLFLYINRIRANRIASGGDVYKRSVTAIRAAMENRTQERLRKSTEDFFEWNENWDMDVK